VVDGFDFLDLKLSDGLTKFIDFFHEVRLLLIEFLLNLSDLVNLLLNVVFLTDERFLHVYLLCGLLICFHFHSIFAFD
jgi:hypothetical protein